MMLIKNLNQTCSCRLFHKTSEDYNKHLKDGSHNSRMKPVKEDPNYTVQHTVKSKTPAGVG